MAKQVSKRAEVKAERLSGVWTLVSADEGEVVGYSVIVQDEEGDYLARPVAEYDDTRKATFWVELPMSKAQAELTAKLINKPRLTQLDLHDAARLAIGIATGN
jgi:hypothetical protein